MLYHEKKTIATLFSGIAILAAYCIFAWGKYQAGGKTLESDLAFWAVTMLMFIGIGIISTIIILIVFHVALAVVSAAKKEEPDFTMDDDEMVKLVELKSARISFIMVGVGFVASLILLAMNRPAALMLNVMFFSFSLGSLLEGFVQLYFYRTGINNG